MNRISLDFQPAFCHILVEILFATVGKTFSYLVIQLVIQFYNFIYFFFWAENEPKGDSRVLVIGNAHQWSILLVGPTQASQTI